MKNTENILYLRSTDRGFTKCHQLTIAVNTNLFTNKCLLTNAGQIADKCSEKLSSNLSMNVKITVKRLLSNVLSDC